MEDSVCYFISCMLRYCKIQSKNFMNFENVASCFLYPLLAINGEWGFVMMICLLVNAAASNMVRGNKCLFPCGVIAICYLAHLLSTVAPSRVPYVELCTDIGLSYPCGCIFPLFSTSYISLYRLIQSDQTGSSD